MRDKERERITKSGERGFVERERDGRRRERGIETKGAVCVYTATVRFARGQRGWLIWAVFLGIVPVGSVPTACFP